MDENTQDKEVLKRIEREVRMREGASKLLAACSQREQALEASKSLLTSNARILASLSQLQKIRKDQILQRAGCRSSEVMVPCTGKVAISDLRIPLMWKDSEYFKNKGELHRCAVFCLLLCGTEIYDTDLVMVDRTLTDICFEDTVVFGDVGPDFHLRVELYSSCVVEDFPQVTLAPRRMSLLGGSMGCSTGIKLRAAFESAAVCGAVTGEGDVGHGNVSLPDLSTLGPKYNLLAHTTLKIEHVQESFKTHDLSLATAEDSPFWLPLYGNVCCRLVAQPLCVTTPVISGQFKVKKTEELNCLENVYGLLKWQSLTCYQSQDHLESEDEPLLVIPFNKDTVVRASESDSLHPQTIVIETQYQQESVSYALITPSLAETKRWTEAFSQHIYNLGHWKQCCQRLMKIEMPSPRKNKAAKPGSLYHEMVTPSSPSDSPAVPDLSVEIRTLLFSYHKESY